MRKFLMKSFGAKMDRVGLACVVFSVLAVRMSVSAYNSPLRTNLSSNGNAEVDHSRHRKGPMNDALVRFRPRSGNFYSRASTDLGSPRADLRSDDDHGHGPGNMPETETIFRTNLSRPQRRAPYNAGSQVLVTKLSDMGEDFIETLSELAFTFLDSDIPSLYANMTSEEIFRSYVQFAKNVIRTSAKSVLSLAISRISEFNISSDCQSSLIQFILDIKDLDLWTIRMLDAWAKPPSGIWMGSSMFLGSYDECLDIRHSMPRSGMTIHGQDCLVELSIHPQLQPFPKSHNFTVFKGDGWKWSRFTHMLFSSKTFGRLDCLVEICVPSLCTPRDVADILNVVSDAFKLVHMNVLSCESKQDHQWTSLQIRLGIVVVVLFLLVCLGTAAHHVVEEANKDGNLLVDKTPANQTRRLLTGMAAIVTCFSVWHPVNELWKHSTAQQALTKTNVLPGITGFKALLMTMIILLHTYLYTLATSSKDYLLMIQSFRQQVYYHGIFNLALIVDTFFLITGMLYGFAYTGRLKGRRVSHLIPTFLRRYLRIMPSFLGALGLLHLMPRVATGPRAAYVRSVILAEDSCRDNWWKVFLAIQNSVGRHGTMQDCLPFTWYGAVDVQLMALFLIPLFILSRWPKRAAIILGVMGFASLCYSYYVLERNYADVYRKYDHPRYLEAFMAMVSDSQWFLFPHVITYVIGIGLGYVTWFYREIKLLKVVQVVLWTVTLSTIFTVLWGTYFLREYLGSLEPAPKTNWLSYLLVKRAAWSLANSWILFALVSGRVRVLTRAFESRVMTLMGRMSLSMYVVHVFVIVARLSLLRENLSANHYQTVCEFILNFVFCVPLSIVFYALVECPFTKLTELVLSLPVKTCASASEKAQFDKVQTKM